MSFKNIPQIKKSIIIYIVCILIIDTNQKLKLLNPQELKDQLKSTLIAASYGNFGRIRNGFKSQGTVFISQNLNKDPNYSCNSLRDININIELNSNDYFPIILVNKGNCSYTKMARNVQNAGGYLALIINDVEGDPLEYPVQNDGSGWDIHIPVGLISLSDGQTIYNFIKNHPKIPVQILVEFNFIKTDIVTLDIYTTITDSETFSMLEKFYFLYKNIKNDIKMNIYYITFAIDGLDNDEQNTMCVSKGKYCFNNKLPFSKNYSGRELILDSLFHQCFYQVVSVNETNKFHPEYFFSFAYIYYHNCFFNKKYSQFCGKEITGFFKHFNINNVYKCMIESFQMDSTITKNINEINFNNDNLILKNNIEKVTSKKIRTFPTVEINNVKMEGGLIPEDILFNICDAFNYMPDGCKNYFFLSPKTKTYNGIIIISIIGIFLIINIIILVVCRKNIVRKINEKFNKGKLDIDGRINAIVGNYFALQDRSGEYSKVENK